MPTSAAWNKPAAAGRDLAAIRSVASFFISRVDSEVDTQFDRIATSQATQLKGKAAIANARLAYQAYEEVIASQRWQQLAGLGAQPQRPLWASTGIKNHAYPDTMYVTELIAPGTVNTMPGTTLAAFADHGEVTGNTIGAGTTMHAASWISWPPPASTSTTSPDNSSAKASPSSRRAGTS